MRLLGKIEILKSEIKSTSNHIVRQDIQKRCMFPTSTIIFDSRRRGVKNNMPPIKTCLI